MNALSELALTIAASQVGEDEKPHGSNWGHPVKDYLASVGLDFPASWCMAFVYWCFGKAADLQSVENTLIKTGGVMRQWNAINKRYKTATPAPGAIFIEDHGHGLGHTGIIEHIEDGLLHTIEGNTNNDGSRNGYEVERKIRNQLKCKGFIDLSI